MIKRTSSISNFKKFVLAVIMPYFIALLLIGLVFTYFFEKKIILGSDISGAYKVNRIITSTDTNEVIFLGSSRAEGTFIPDSLVNNGFNYGMNGTQDDVILFFLREECKKKNKNTPIIINFDLDGLSYDIGDISNYLYNVNYSPVKKLLDTNYRAVYSLPFLKYYGYFELYSKYYLNAKTNLTKFTNNGASLEKNVLPEEEFKQLVKERLQQTYHFENDPLLEKEFYSIINANKNRLFVFVVVPYHYSFFNKFGNYEAAKQYLSSLEKSSNVKVLNFANLNFPDSYFINTTHLNLKGALEFNKILKDSLKPYMRGYIN